MRVVAPILPAILKPKRNISRKRISKEVEVVRTSSWKPNNKEFVEAKMITFS